MTWINITIIRMADIIESLGLSYEPSRRDDYAGRCSGCGETVGQNVEECAACNTPVIWYGSKLWRQLFGSPEAVLRELTRPQPDDDDALGSSLLDGLGLTGFANMAQKKRWNRARKKVKPERLEGMIKYVKENTHQRGTLPRLLNWTDKVIREQKPKSKQAPAGKSRVALPPLPGE